MRRRDGRSADAPRVRGGRRAVLAMIILCALPLPGRAAEVLGDALAPLRSALAEAAEQKAVLEALAEEARGKALASNNKPQGDEPPELPAPAGFTRETHVTVNGELRLHLVERFDPRAEGDARWTTLLVEPAERAEKIKPQHQGADGTFAMYAFTLGGLDPEAAVPVEPPADGEPGLAYFRFAKVPQDMLQGDGAAYADKLEMLVGVDARAGEPHVRELVMHLPEPTRLKLIAKVREFTWRIRYRPLAAGSRLFVPEEMTTKARFKILFRGEEESLTTVSWRDWSVTEAGTRLLAP
ncbi:MAG: hypothetical protein KatS3mg119_2273 [Rhodothalassiaceae bacterium]|nr:MAG: hypothetical protein KatS3mg119_2273 [Rhodothalassiaceae bacterium]